MDGASATTAAVSLLGAGTLSLLAKVPELAPLCFATAGACVGFLPRNLANPARIFMGDGGSLPLGMLVAAVAMASVTREYLGANGVVVAALLVGLVIFDTTLVTISRSRAGRSVLAGGRDHTTHRLGKLLGSPRNVALTLGLTQFFLCAVTITVAQAGGGWILLAGGLCVGFAVALGWHFETSLVFRVDAPQAPSTPEAPRPTVDVEPAPGLAWPSVQAGAPLPSRQP
jgi:UDP-GlcNAc:undecaprenyl-phosphate GlcNAc-1-phosphate transferase